MYVYVIVFIVAVVLPVLRLGPVVTRRRKGAWNNALLVNLPPDGALRHRGEMPQAVRAQEVTDWVHRWLGALAFCAPLLLVLEGRAGEYIMLLALFLATFWAKIFERHFELVGHGVEILVAERAGLLDYRELEIVRMQESDATFRGWSFARIERGLRRRRWIARAFLTALPI